MHHSTKYFLNNRIPIIWIIITLVLIAVSYSGITNHKLLNWDDIDYLVKNDRIREFSVSNILWMFSDFSMANWHPLTWLSYTFNYAFWGNNPVAYKAVNLIIHSLNSILVCVFTYKVLILARDNYHIGTGTLFSRLVNRDLLVASLFIATLFGIHPLHVESVSWISERKDVLYSFFFLLTFLSYLKYRESSTNSKWLVISVIMFLCSLMSKPMAVTMPALLILLDIYPLNILKNKKSIKAILGGLFDRKITFIILALLVSVITILTQKSGIQGAERLAFDSRVINACLSILLYVYNYFLPIDLSTYYSFHPWSTDPSIFSLFPVTIIGLITIAFIYLAIRKNIIFPIIAWLFLLISLAPVIGIIKVGAQAAADRYTYMPLLSLFIISASYVGIIFNYSKGSITKMVVLSSTASIIIILFSFLTYQQNKYWKNDFNLWTRAIDYSPGISAVPYSNLGTNYFQKGESRTAVILFNKALAIQPDDITTMERIGKAYELMREETFAISAYKDIIKAHPTNPIGYIRLGDMFYRKRLIDQAKQFYNKAFELSPVAPSTLQRSALVDYLERNYESAEEKLNYLQIIRPNDTGGLQLLAKIMIDTDRRERAKEIAVILLNKNSKDKFAWEIMQDERDSLEQTLVP